MSAQRIFVATEKGGIFQVSEVKISKGVTLVQRKSNGKWYTLVGNDQIFHTETINLTDSEKE